MQRTCSVHGCEKPHNAKGFCDPHYRRYLKYGSPLASKTPFMKPECSVSGCSTVSECKGMCKAHYSRFVRNGSPTAGRVGQGGPLRWIKEHASHGGDECLIWPFRRRGVGYGELNYGGARACASMVMCLIAHGPKPSDSHQAAHSCGNGSGGCVNPLHIRWATRSENERDKISHGTSNHGSRHPLAKLSEHDVLGIRAMASAGGKTHAAIATEYGVSRSAVGLIVTRARWSHI